MMPEHPGRHRPVDRISRVALPIVVDDQTMARAWNGTINLARLQNLTAYESTCIELALRRDLPLATQLEGQRNRCSFSRTKFRGVDVLQVMDGEPSGWAARPCPDSFRCPPVQELPDHRGRDVQPPEDCGKYGNCINKDEVMERRRVRDDDHEGLDPRREAAWAANSSGVSSSQTLCRLRTPSVS